MADRDVISEYHDNTNIYERKSIMAYINIPFRIIFGKGRGHGDLKKRNMQLVVAVYYCHL